MKTILFCFLLPVAALAQTDSTCCGTAAVPDSVIRSRITPDSILVADPVDVIIQEPPVVREETVIRTQGKVRIDRLTPGIKLLLIWCDKNWVAQDTSMFENVSVK